ncbi:MAG: KEOPS complex subunit Cgi121 [Haloarculaceae archaeon]
MRLVEGIATVEDVESFVDRLAAIGDDHGATVQAFDARYVLDREHLRRAVDLADRAIERGENVARDRAVEILCYAAGRRQIHRALEMGVDEGEMAVVVLVDGGDGGRSSDASSSGVDASDASSSGVDASDASSSVSGDESAAAGAVADLLAPAETLGRYDDDRVRAFFDVQQRELAATDGSLADAVHERVALLDVEK